MPVTTKSPQLGHVSAVQLISVNPASLESCILQQKATLYYKLHCVYSSSQSYGQMHWIWFCSQNNLGKSHHTITSFTPSATWSHQTHKQWWPGALFGTLG